MAPLPGGFISHFVLREQRNEVLGNRKVFRRVVRYSDDFQLFGNFCETQMAHDLAIQEAKEGCSARKAIGEHLLAYLDKEIGTCGRTTRRSALKFWRNKIRNMNHH
jgi:hypothetical protein